MYRSGSRILDILHLSLNLIVIPLIFNRRTYPPSSSRTWTVQLPTNLFSLHACFLINIDSRGWQADFGLDIIALLRKPPRRVPAVLLICLVSLPLSACARKRFRKRENWISSLKPNLYGSLLTIGINCIKWMYRIRTSFYLKVPSTEICWCQTQFDVIFANIHDCLKNLK